MMRDIRDAANPAAEPTDANPLGQPRLGRVLRELREPRGHTLAAVARGTGISTSFLSLVEKGRSDISLGRLYRLLRFYGVSLDEFFSEERVPRPEVIRRGQARRFELPEEGFQMFLQAPDTRRLMMPVLALHDPGKALSDVPPHDGEVFLYILEGTLMVERDGKEPLVLHEGDSAYLARTERQTSSAVGTAPARVIAVTAPPPPVLRARVT